MIVNHVWTSVFLVVILAVCLLVVGGAQERRSVSGVNLLKSAELRGQTVIPLGPKRVVMLHEGEAQNKEVPVMLVETEYYCQLVRVGKDSGRKETSMSLLCYEMRSKGDVPYTWAMWSARGGRGHFRLFTDDQGNNFLAWVEFSDVIFTEVSKPKDPLVELTRYLSQAEQDEFQRLPVVTIVPDVRSWGVNALYFDISVRSIEKDAAGKITVTFSGPEPEKIYCVVRDGAEWQRK